MMPSRQRYLGPSEEATIPRSTTPMSHVASVSSRSQLIEIAFRPVSPRSDFQQFHSGQSAPKLESRSIGDIQTDPANLKYWKPYTIRRPFLIFLMVLALSFIGVTEILYYYSQKNQALWFVQNEDELSTAQNFAIQYLPTLLAVCYGILWSLVDLDVKRLEPFYQLGSKGGAGVDALFLEYQFQFPLAVPFRSFRKRHWAVLLSSSTFLLCTLVAAPLLSGLIDDKKQSINKMVSFKSSSRFITSGDKLAPLSPEYIFAATTVLKHNSSFPPFTTAEFSAIPFEPHINLDQAGPRETWKGPTTAYRLAVECTEARMEPLDDWKNKTIPSLDTFGDGLLQMFLAYYRFKLPNTDCECRYPVTLDTQEESSTVSGSVSWGRASPWCGPGNMTTFATYEQPTQRYKNPEELVGYWCTPRGIESATIEVEVDAATRRVKSVFGKPEFKRDWNLGEIDLGPFDQTIFNPASIEKLGPDWGIFTKPPMGPSGFLENSGLNFVANPELFQQELVNIYRLWFAMAVGTSNTFMVNATESTSMGVRSLIGVAVVIDRTFATLVDVCFGAIFLNCLLLCIYFYQRRSTLLSDPDSLSGILALVAGSDILQALEGLDRANSFQIKEALQDGKYGLGIWSDQGEGAIYKLDWLKHASKKGIDQIREEKGPRTLRLAQGLFFLFCLVVLMCFISILLVLSRKPASLPAISDNNFVFRLIWSALPTLVATLMEPMWASFNRDVSVLQPFYNLMKRNMPASRTISQKYSVVPLALTFRAFKNRDILLGTVSSMTVLTNVLAVTLPGIFDNTMRPVQIPISLESSYSPRFDRNGSVLNYENLTTPDFFSTRRTFSTAFDIARANITDHISLPSWTSSNLTFIPKDLDPTHEIEVDEYSVMTTGLGVNFKCQEIINGTTGSIFQNKNETTTVYFRSSVVPGFAENGNESCQAEFGWKVPSEAIDGATAPQIEFGRFPRLEVGNPAELYEKVVYDDGSGVPVSLFRFPSDLKTYPNRRECENLIVTAWSSRHLSSITNSNGTTWMQIRPPNHTILVCRPQLTSQDFEVTVDKVGAILHNKPAGDLIVHELSSDIFSGNHDTMRILNGIFYPTSTESRDWPGFLMTRLAKSSSKNFFKAENLRDLTQATYSLVLSIFISEFRDNLLVKESPRKIDYIATKLMTRVEMSVSLTLVSLGILLLYCITIVFIYSFRGGRILPRHPTTLAATIAYFWDSRLLEDMRDMYHMSTAERETYLSRKGDSYGFGWYQGQSGRESLGVDREPLLRGYKEQKNLSELDHIII